ncbi:MAG: Uma2 family endonuclease [Acetobacteraceae bacterium]
MAWDSGDGVRYELVDGEPRAMAPASVSHGLLQGRLAMLIGNHLERNRPACSVVVAPGVTPRLLSSHNVRIPDLAVTCAPITPSQALLPEPVLLIEILSPSNQADTWSNVRAYTSITTVEEILVVHANRTLAEVLRRGPDGLWPGEPAPLTSGTLELASIGFVLELARLYRPAGSTG